MRQLFADFSTLAERPGLGLSVVLGRSDRHPEFAGLQPYETVLLVEPGNLYAEATAMFLETGEPGLWWYGVIGTRQAIHELAPDQAAPAL